MTPATSVSFFRSEFDDFLYAAIGADKNGMPLSVLSALTRLDVDPWQEAAELSEMPKDKAAARLQTLIARLPGPRMTQADLRAIADRLTTLLPRVASATVPLAEKASGHQDVTTSAVAKVLNWLKNRSGRH